MVFDVDIAENAEIGAVFFFFLQGGDEFCVVVVSAAAGDLMDGDIQRVGHIVQQRRGDPVEPGTPGVGIVSDQQGDGEMPFFDNAVQSQGTVFASAV